MARFSTRRHPAPTCGRASRRYGGAAYVVSNGIIYFSEFSDQRLYRLKPGGVPEPMTPQGLCRYADATVDVRRRRLICVREDHAIRGREPFSDSAKPKKAPDPELPLPDPETTIVAIPLDGPETEGEVLASGSDFYSTPRLSPDGSHLAWLSWRHPNMPWNGTELWLADVGADGRLEHARTIAGGDNESIYQPGWSPDGLLYFVSDRTNWWNLYRAHHDEIEPVYPIDADCGRPQWTLGSATWSFTDDKTLVVACAKNGQWNLRRLRLSSSTDAKGGLRIAEDTELTAFEPGEYLAANQSHVVFLGGSPHTPDAILRIDLATRTAETVRASSARPDAATLSLPQAIEFPTEGGLTAHAFFYSAESRLPDPPPLIVMSHGGPTGAASARFDPEIQFWTRHGFAVVDVNYGGSSGFGRAYRERLDDNWGVVDVADCVNAAAYLSRERLADPHRLVIRGRSAGGYTTLAALTFRPDVFAAGASYYGIGDLELLVNDTHKFESRYCDRLVGPYPERRDLYLERSPIHYVDRLACPLILFQGLDDKVVPPEHAERMAAAVRAKGLRVELVEFPGEGHGFRRAETIARCRDEELAFYRAALGIPLLSSQ